MRAIEALKEVTGVLKGFGIESPEKEAEILLKCGLNINALEIYRDNQELKNTEITTLKNILNRRLLHEPIQYICGYEEFLGLKILVGRGVLIPRPETELLVEEAVMAIKGQESEVRILDLCTGSGCIALALAKEFPDAQVYGVDVSEVAIWYANKNAEINGINNVTFLKGNLFEPIGREFIDHGLRFSADLIISNPPYIKRNEIKNLQPEIKDWEPVIALDGGMDGIDFYREIIPQARHFLTNKGIIMFELGNNQAEYVSEILISVGYINIKIIKDYKGTKRIIQAEWIR